MTPASPIWSLAPQAALAAGVIAALVAGMVGDAPRAFLRSLGIAALLVALAFAGSLAPGPAGPLVGVDGLGRAWQFLFYLGALPVAALLKLDDEVPLALLLGSALGMGLLSASSSLLMLFIGLEFMSLPAYLLVARGGGRSPSSREAAIKYFFAGGTAGALFLLGMTLYYAASKSLALVPASGTLADLGLALMGAAALFKIGAVPLHFWLPDVYEASAPELAGFLSTSMKAAGILLLMRLTALAPGSTLAQALPAVGALTMAVGALTALRQEKLQRLLAYSSISHAGYLIFGVGAWAALGATGSGAVSVYFYLAAYVFMSNGAFAFLRASGLSTRAELRGYAGREPRLAALFAALLLALGGIPPTAGFLAKLLVLWDGLRAGLYAATVVGALAAVVSLGYYLSLIRDAYFETGDGAPAAEAAYAHRSSERFVLLACAIPAAVLGLAPWIVGVLGGVLVP